MLVNTDSIGNMSKTDKVQWVYSSQNNQELTERYDIWAKDYEQDLDDAFGYVGPEPGAEVLVNYVSKDAKILDAGAGTGLVGQLLHQRGYHHLEAMDISSGMLEEARKKNVYTSFHQQVLGEPLDFPSATFDAIISVGVFTYGHVKSNAFDELIRITKPGGYIVVTMPTDLYESNEFKPKLTALEESGQWEMVTATKKFLTHQKKDTGVYLKVWVYKVC
ncbi:MAG: class I SAM-dependent methyltransferase [Moorea sp. SIO3H5]|nr:class I SAM-dependent methyltransferase [Moorena sp. SIO3H5]